MDSALNAMYPDDPQKRQENAYTLATAMKIQDVYGIPADEVAANYDMYRRALIATSHAPLNPKSAFAAITGQFKIAPLCRRRTST